MTRRAVELIVMIKGEYRGLWTQGFIPAQEDGQAQEQCQYENAVYVLDEYMGSIEYGDMMRAEAVGGTGYAVVTDKDGTEYWLSIGMWYSFTKRGARYVKPVLRVYRGGADGEMVDVDGRSLRRKDLF